MSSANIKHTRKSTATEDKEKKRQSDSPAKEMMKKLAAKEKDKKETPKEKSADKEEKNVEKQDKKQEKSADKKEDKTKDDKGEKSSKTDKAEKRSDKPKQNGSQPKAVQNGVSDVMLNANGGGDEANGTVSADSDEEAAMVIDDHDQDELFPELTYDETSDNECFEPPTPESAPSRSFTRRSQVKSTRTPETPRPASDKQAAESQSAEDHSKESKLKPKDDTPASDRKLRSADSPKPETRKSQDATKDKEDDKKQESDKTDEVKEDSDKSDKVQEKSDKADAVKEKGDKTEDSVKEGDKKGNEALAEGAEVVEVVIDITGDDKEKDETEEKSDKIEIDVVVEIEGAEEGSRKTDTNYSKSRVKVSPYRRSMRLAEQAETAAHANVSLVANYTGNNTTMEMDITESSFMSEDGNPDSSGYLRGLRNIRGRSSYKPLKEYVFKHTANRSARSTASAVSEQQCRPTGTVVGRKRKPEGTEKEEAVETANEATEYTYVAHKRMRLLDRIAMPFRRTATLPNIGQSRRTAEIVGINTDLPLTAPVVSTETFDPESLKGAVPPPPPAANEPVATPLPAQLDRDSKKCVIA